MEIKREITSSKSFSTFDISDDEIQVIGGTEVSETRQPDQGQAPRRPRLDKEPESPRKKRWIWLAVLILSVAAILALIFLNRRKKVEPDVPGIFEKPDTVIVETPAAMPVEKLGDYSDTTASGFVEVLSKTINDVPLTILIPHNATAELCIGVPDYRDKDIIMAYHAADIRRDNKKIVGAFVLKGEPLAWGLSKRGYCAILGDSLTVGVADNSPLFEQATEEGGYFFRQYALVENGKLVENEPKNKSYRKALCERAGEHFVVLSQTQESFHDFSQALVDLGCSNAIYLVGGDAYGFYKDSEGNCTEVHDLRRQKYRFENFILWRKTSK